jgi:hypothetical protein
MMNGALPDTSPTLAFTALQIRWLDRPAKGKQSESRKPRFLPISFHSLICEAVLPAPPAKGLLTGRSLAKLRIT